MKGNTGSLEQSGKFDTISDLALLSPIAIYKNYIEQTTNLEILQPSDYTIKVKLELEKNLLKTAIVSGKVMEEE